MNVQVLSMFKSLFFIAMLFMSGCMQIQPDSQISNIKTFDREDEFIMYGLDAEVRHNYGGAAQYFNILYTKTNNMEYRYRTINMLMKNENYDQVITITSEQLLRNDDDAKLMRFKVAALLEVEKIEKAKSLALELVAMTKEEGDYLILSQIYQKQENFEMSMKYLESAYAINYGENILDTLAVTLYVNLGRKDEAISYLETHNRLHGCSEIVCNRLAGFYSNQNNIEGMLSIYMRMYAENQNVHVGEAIVNIYNYQQDFPKLTVFLEENKINSELLLRLYVNAKNYKKAALLAKEIYQESGESYFLGQSAIFSYESSENKNDTAMLNKVIKELKNAVLQNEDALFLNYLGYLMIDHNLDIEEGMEYVNRALDISPDSVFYLDSLAWGYYKQKRCKEAYKLMKQVEESLGQDDEEVQDHMRAIEKCLKEKDR
ncbi:MAG: hypothetical protein U9P71_05685 [Campylobacterota bacterium]|nr:hypothetical protein [Campylobacterota bacterium]